eukprot:GGOE01049557.1.p1 GENE.GGOE01049557.1~~GGOE01049557.1.p1  ORF type:complete len:225 (-),score=68.25 GGOE01049557.1:154-828(-)
MASPKPGKYTPTLDHLQREEFARDVYQPCADSFAFLDALEQDQAAILGCLPTVCLEIGSGSGIVTAFLHWLLAHKGHHCTYLCCDVNPAAARASALTYAVNGVPCDVLQNRFALALLPRLESAVDVLLFNPPYVPTGPEEMAGTGIEVAWAGGADGMEVVDAFLPLAFRLLHPGGRFYLVLIEQNRPRDVIRRVEQIYGWKGEVVLQRRCGERLYVLCFSGPER